MVSRSSNPTSTLTLSDCENIQSSGAVGVKVYLTTSDLRTLKLDRELGTSNTDSFLAVAAGNGFTELGTSDELRVYSTADASQTAAYIPDTTNPEVIENGFIEFDLDSGQFTIAFTEPMDSTSISVPGTLVFQHHSYVTLAMDVFEVQSLACSSCADGENVTFTLPSAELNRLKLNPRVCSSAANCWLTILTPGNFIHDMAGNMVVELPNGSRSSQRYLGSYIDDITGPFLEAFSLDMSLRELVLTFDEPVDSSTVNVGGVSIQNGPGVVDESLFYHLTSEDLVLSESGIEMTVLLSDTDVNALQSRPDVATSRNDTYLSLDMGVVLDLSYMQNPSQAIANIDAKLAAVYVPDVAPPEVEGFDLDFDSNSLTLIFSEPVLVSTINLEQLVLHSSPVRNISWQLTGGDIQPTELAASSEVTFTLTNADATFLEVSQDIATDSSNTYLSALAGLAVDTNGITSTEIPVSASIQVSNLIPDDFAPSVITFGIDMNLGELTIIFDDVMDASTFDVSAITLQSMLYRVPMEWHTLSGDSSTSSTENGFEVTVTIGPEDLNRVKQIRNLTTSSANTYLTAAATIADDVHGVDTVALTDGKSLQAVSFTEDSTRPNLESWSLDMNVGQIIMTFSETVDILTLQFSQITLQVSDDTSDSYSLTGVANLIPPDADYRFAIQLTEADSNFVKAHTGLGTSRDNSYLSITANTIVDMNSNIVFPIPNGQALQAESFIPDTSDPMLRSFSIDMNLGVLSLTFDETVNAASFNVSAVTLVNRASQYSSSYTPESSTASTIDSSIIEVTLAKVDLDAIKAISNLASSASDTYVIAPPYTVRDMNGNSLSEITSDAALQVSEYTEDSTPPEIVGFDIDMSLEQIHLSFSETVRATSLDPTQITIQSFPSGAGTTVTLTTGTYSQEDSTLITLQLGEDDTNMLKLLRDIATSRTNTFLSLTANAVQDPTGTSLVAVPSNNAIQVTDFTDDLISPQLVSFNLNLDQQTLILTFDETIDSGTFSIISVALQDSANDPTQSVRLSSRSTTESTDGTVFVIQLSSDDFNDITATFPLATMETNTFITLTAGAVDDTRGNPSIEIPSSNAIQISSHTADVTKPLLVEFDFDLNLGILTLIFSESVNITSFNPTQVTLQSAQSSPVYTFTLTGGLVTLPESTTIDIDLLPSDLNAIKAITALASLRSNTYLSVTSATVKDMNMNYVLPVTISNAILVNQFTSDDSGAILERFDLNYNSGVLTLSFDETVQLSTFNPAAITLQSAPLESANSYTLIASMVLDSGLLTFSRLQLEANDFNELKRLRICVDELSCYISVSTSLIQDVPGNQNVEIVGTSPLQISDYIADTTDPKLIRYVEFDLDGGTFILEFSENIDSSNIDISQVELHKTYANATSIFTFQELRLTTGDSNLATFELGSNDLNSLKLDTSLCTYDGNCWIRLTSDFISDVNGNPIEAILPNTIDTFHQPEIFQPDITSPELQSYTIDLNTGRMTFTFDEVIRLATFTPMNLTFQDAPLATASLNFREYGGFARTTNGLSINWNMTIPDLNLLKSYEGVHSMISDSYLTFDNLIEDESGNGITPRVDGSALQASTFTADTIRPRLESFLAFNFDNASFSLLFNEPVNLSSIKLAEIAITRNYTFDTRIYDPIRINDWYSLYYENGSIYNLTHLFVPGEYILTCPFSLEPTTETPTEPSTSEPENGGSGSFSGSGSASGLGLNMSEIDAMLMQETGSSLYPILLRGCDIYRNLTVIEPFLFLTGGNVSYIDERKQQVLVSLNRDNLRALKLRDLLASNHSNTWVAFNDTALSDMSRNAVIPTNLFNATQLHDGAFVDDVTPPDFEFITLDMDSSTLFLHYNDVMDIQSVDPFQIQILDAPGSNNSYILRGPYNNPQELLIDPRDDYAIPIPLSFDDMNALKNNLDLATSQLNTYFSFPVTVATDIYGNYPTFGFTPEAAEQVEVFIPDETGAILLGFEVNLNTEILTLYFSEVVNPTTFIPGGITIQNLDNSSLSSPEIPEFESHTLTAGVPLINDTGVSTLEVYIDLGSNALKIFPNLSNSVNDTYITIQAGTVLDMNNNPNQPILDGEALQALDITPDTSPPFLEYFDLDLNDNLLILKFSEAVLPSAFNISGITILSTPTLTGSTDFQTLDSNSQVFTTEYESLVHIRFTAQDEEEIKDTDHTIAKSRNSTYIAIQSITAEDYYGFQVLNISMDNPLQVRDYFEGEYKINVVCISYTGQEIERCECIRTHFTGP